MIGWLALVGGGLMLVIGSFWGRAGYYESQTPILLFLVLGGAAIGVSGILLLRKPKQEVTPVAWRRTTDDSEQ